MIKIFQHSTLVKEFEHYEEAVSYCEARLNAKQFVPIENGTLCFTHEDVELDRGASYIIEIN